jgi:hypothetical protein
MGTRNLSRGLSSQGVKPHHSPPSSADIKNWWSYISAPTLCFHGMVKDSITHFTFIINT